MAIAKMNRFTLLTFHDHKQALLTQLQVFGDVHLKSPSQEELAELAFLQSDFSQDKLSSYEVELEKVRFAVAKLAPYVEKPGMRAKRPTLTYQEFDQYAASYDYEDIYRKIKEQDEIISGVKAEISRRQAESDLMESWRLLDVAPADLDSLERTGYLIGTVNRQALTEFASALEAKFDTLYLEELDTVKEDTALLLLFPAEHMDDVNAFAREQGFTKAAVQLRGKPETVMEENETIILDLREKQLVAEDVIKGLAPEHPKLQIALDYFETVLERERASRNFLRSDTTLLIEGWIPADDSQKLKDILGAVCGEEYFLEETEEERDSASVPIKLKNNKFVSAFSDITAMYAMPRYNEIDPTPILAPFYWLFFGLMVGDIGYGVLLLLGTTLAPKLLDLKEGMKNFMKFFQYLSVAVIVAGVLYGGLFGVTVFHPISYVTETGEIATKAILDSQLDIVTMLILSIVIGVVHIMVGLGTKAFMCFRDGKPFDAFCDGILWMLTVITGIGGLLGIAGIMPVPIIGTICGWGFWACLVGLVLTQGRSSPSMGGKIGNGLYGAYGLTSYVGDIVSYTRIVALALSGAYIAYAFNLMTGLVVGEFGAGNIAVSLIRLVFGIIIVVFGQALNLGLALLGAYVHTCRLQYVEFFGKFYEGGGVVFNPLCLKNQHTHITK